MIHYTSLFSSVNFKKNDKIISNLKQKMVEESGRHQNLGNQRQFRLKKINEIKDYVITEIRGKEIISKRLSK